MKTRTYDTQSLDEIGTPSEVLVKLDIEDALRIDNVTVALRWLVLNRFEDACQAVFDVSDITEIPLSELAACVIDLRKQLPQGSQYTPDWNTQGYRLQTNHVATMREALGDMERWMAVCLEKYNDEKLYQVAEQCRQIRKKLKGAVTV